MPGMRGAVGADDVGIHPGREVEMSETFVEFGMEMIRTEKKWNLVGLQKEGQLRTLIFRYKDGKEEALAFHIGDNAEIDIIAIDGR